MDAKLTKMLRNFTMFLSGIVLLQPLSLGLETPYFTIRRFNIPESCVDLFISKLNNSMQFFYFLAMLLDTVYFALAPRWLQKYNSYISVGTNWSTVVTSGLVMLSYVVNGEEGSLSFYYYMLTLASFAFGLNQLFVITVGVREIPWYAGSIPLTSLLVVVYQLLFSYVFEKRGLSDLHFWIILVQAMISMLICALTSVLWTLFYMDPSVLEDEQADPEGGAEEDELVLDASLWEEIRMSKYVIICSAFGLGLVYATYPSIVPYKLTDIKSAYSIHLASMVSTALASMFITIVCEFTRHGPNKNWTATNSKWKYSLVSIAPYLFAQVFFVAPLHFPDSPLGRFVLSNKHFVGALCVLYAGIHGLLTTIGYSAGPFQTTKPFNRRVTTLNTLFALFCMVVVILYSQGYLMLYTRVKAGTESFPDSMGNFRRFFRWLGLSFVYGWRAFKGTFTLDIKGDILSAS